MAGLVAAYRSPLTEACSPSPRILQLSSASQQPARPEPVEGRGNTGTSFDKLRTSGAIRRPCTLSPRLLTRTAPGSIVGRPDSGFERLGRAASASGPGRVVD